MHRNWGGVRIGDIGDSYILDPGRGQDDEVRNTSSITPSGGVVRVCYYKGYNLGGNNGRK